MKVEPGSAWKALGHSAEGLKRSGSGMAAAAADMASSTARVLSDDPVGSVAAVDARLPPDLQDSVIDMKRHSYAHMANGRVMKQANMALESLLDVMHPARQSDD